MKLTTAQITTTSIAVVTMISLLTIIWFFSYSMRELVYEFTRVRMNHTVQLASASLSNAVVEEDLEKIDFIVNEILTSDYDVERMCVFNQKDVRVSSGRCAQVVGETIPGNIITEAPIIVNGVTHGYVGLAYNIDQRYQTLSQYQDRMFFIAACTFLITVGVTWYIGRVFRLELDSLHKVFNIMAEQGQFRPLRSTPIVELQRITDSFNKVIAKQNQSSDKSSLEK